MAEEKRSQESSTTKPDVAWTKAFTPWGVPCSQQLVDGHTESCRDQFGLAVPATAVRPTGGQRN